MRDDAPAELAILEAMRVVKAEGTHPLLTQASDLLAWAKNLVSEFHSEGRTMGNIGAGGQGRYVIEHYRDGKLLDTIFAENLIVTEGLNDCQDQYWRGSSYSAEHYLGLMDSSPTVAASDTMLSHAGWSEETGYDESARPTYSPAASSGGVVTNSASKAEFTLNADATIGGVFCTTNSTKSGTTGKLFSAAAFTGGDRSFKDNDVISITYQHTYSDAG